MSVRFQWEYAAGIIAEYSGVQRRISRADVAQRRQWPSQWIAAMLMSHKWAVSLISTAPAFDIAELNMPLLKCYSKPSMSAHHIVMIYNVISTATVSMSKRWGLWNYNDVIYCMILYIANIDIDSRQQPTTECAHHGSGLPGHFRRWPSAVVVAKMIRGNAKEMTYLWLAHRGQFAGLVGAAVLSFFFTLQSLPAFFINNVLPVALRYDSMSAGIEHNSRPSLCCWCVTIIEQMRHHANAALSAWGWNGEANFHAAMLEILLLLTWRNEHGTATTRYWYWIRPLMISAMPLCLTYLIIVSSNIK